MISQFQDRHEAGKILARFLQVYANRPDVLVLALPRGGVPVAFEVARALGAPLDILLVRKLGVPGYEEVAMGAIAAGGFRLINMGVVRNLGITNNILNSVISREERELARRERLYRGNQTPLAIADRAIILVDDGLATGATMRVAVAALRKHLPARIVVAVPIAARSACEEMKSEVDDVVCAVKPDPFYAVGLWYADFSETTDEEVRECLEIAGREQKMRDAAADADGRKAWQLKVSSPAGSP
jgi:putative phosphoribosyl transferase